MNTHVMLDLETMGTGNEAAIIAIGAAKFDPEGSDIIEAFYVRVSLESSLAAGMKIDGSTVMWWLGEERAEARRALLATEAQHIEDALFGFSQWFGDSSQPVWGNGATFDNVILRNAYAKLMLPAPWSYRDDRCYRTVKALAPHIEPVTSIGVEHQALDDAKYQARHLQAIVAAGAVKLRN